MLLFAALASLALAPGPSQAQQGIARIAGAWEIVGPSGRSGCENGQIFTPSADRRYVQLTEGGGADIYQARYIVLQVQSNRILMFIEGEERTTAQGDPVLWWAVFDSPDRFRWRRYDWPVGALTDGEWRRCTT
jgi:hypothetical protein